MSPNITTAESGTDGSHAGFFRQMPVSYGATASATTNRPLANGVFPQAPGLNNPHGLSDGKLLICQVLLVVFPWRLGLVVSLWLVLTKPDWEQQRLRAKPDRTRRLDRTCSG